MLPPEWLCRDHLFFEHNELHQKYNLFQSGYRSAWRFRGRIEPLSLEKRHQELADEYLFRGYKHSTPYQQPCLDLMDPEIRNGTVDRKAAERELRAICPACAERMKHFKLMATLKRKKQRAA